MSTAVEVIHPTPGIPNLKAVEPLMNTDGHG